MHGRTKVFVLWSQSSEPTQIGESFPSQTMIVMGGLFAMKSGTPLPLPLPLPAAPRGSLAARGTTKIYPGCQGRPSEDQHEQVVGPGTRVDKAGKAFDEATD